MSHKRFWLFAGPSYYPSGGLLDFINSFATEREALLSMATADTIGWWQLLDTETMTYCSNLNETPQPFEPYPSL